MDGKVLPIKDLDVPKLLYKFRAPTLQNKATVLAKEIFIPKIKSFNDPQDANLPFRYNTEELTIENIYRKCVEVARRENPGKDELFVQEEAYRMQISDPLQDEYHLEQFDKSQYEKLNKSTGVMCLTPSVHNFLMWSYYSDSHKGFCIGYNSKLLIESQLFGMGGKVMYSHKFPTFPMFPDIHNNTVFLNLLYTKSRIWKHENEYRLLHTFKDGDVKKLHPDTISEIVLGCKFDGKCELTFIDEIIKALPNTAIYKMSLKKNSFGLVKNTVVDKGLLLNF